MIAKTAILHRGGRGDWVSSRIGKQRSARNRGCLGSEATEWWYWVQEKQNNPAMWEEARKVFEL